MMVRLKVFAAAKEIVGDGHVELELVERARVSDLKTALVRHCLLYTSPSPRDRG